jgi:hypothetical protein
MKSATTLVLGRETWGPAPQDIQSVYVTFQPHLAVPGAVETVSAFFRPALDNGTEKLVLLCGRGEPEAMEAEGALQAMRADRTSLRAGWFNQNCSENVFLDSIRTGAVALPTPSAGSLTHAAKGYLGRSTC